MDSLYPDIPGFQILEMLPNAGMSRVYKARQLSLDRVVVLKVLPQNMIKEESDVERFMEEARITAQLKHSNIVQIYDFTYTPDGLYYFVMEFVSGYSMGNWIRRKGRLTEENALVCAQCVAVAMNYAWERARVVHCDIKPDNIMIDGDGTVKVADLGLARSLIASRKKQDDDMVYGTPNYISPEQARGEPDIDCRSDIYSLGATIYHAATGIMPFEDKKNADVMELQVTSYIPDPLDVNPALSIASACLIEKMMAKDKNYRYRNWEELLRDITRARSEKPPFGKMPPEGVSTVLRNKARQDFLANREKAILQKEVAPKRSSTVLIKPTRTRSSIATADSDVKQVLSKLPKELLMLIVLLIAFVLGIILVSKAFSKKKAVAQVVSSKSQPTAILSNTIQQFAATSAVSTMQTSQPPPLIASPPSKDKQIEDKEASAKVMFETAIEWYKAHTNDFDGAILRFQKVSDETRGTKYSLLALAELDRIKEEKDRAIRYVLSSVSSNVALLEKQHEYDKAIAFLKSYNGPFAKEIEPQRMEQIAELSEKKRQWLEHIDQSQKNMDAILKEASFLVLSGNTGEAIEKVSASIKENDINFVKERLQSFLSLISLWSSFEESLAKTFLENKGKDIKVKFLKGEELMFIRDVDGNKIIAEKVNIINAGRISRSTPFKVSDLSLDEKIARLPFTNKLELTFNKTFLLMQHNEYDKALYEVSVLPEWMSLPIKRSIIEYKAKAIENKAYQELAQILSAYRLSSTNLSTNVYEIVKTLNAAKLTPQNLASLKKVIESWAQRYEQCSITKLFLPLIESIQTLYASTNAPIETKSEKSLQKGPVQLENKISFSSTEEFLKKLLELNPSISMQHIKISLDDESQIRTMEITYKDLRDISPIAGVSSIRELIITPFPMGDADRHNYEYAETMPLNDISALKGINLRRLVIRHSSIKDLSALQGMPLEVLDISFSPVSDISPLQNMPLRRLILRGTAITTLESLKGMPLERLDVSFTKVKKIDVLAGMPLKSLNIRKTGVEELTPLLQTQIEELMIDFDIEEFLKGYNNELRRLIKKSETLKFINGRPIPPDKNFRR